MRKKITHEVALGRARMFEEAADHMTLDVADEPYEKAEQKYVEKILRRASERWYQRAADLEN